MSNLPQQLKGITIAIVFFFGLLYVQAWTGAPAGTPPANNVDAPVNVGDSTQYKSGSLGVGGLLKAYSTFNIPTGAGLGKVLISDATGNASWTPVSSLGVVTSISGGSCAVGQVVQSINSTGVVTCVTDAGAVTSESDPTVTASVKDGVSWGEVTGKPTNYSGAFSHVIYNANPTSCQSVYSPLCGSDKDGVSVNSGYGSEVSTGYACLCYWK